MNVTTARIAVAGLGVLVWLYGLQNDHEGARWIGIGLLALAMLLRFVGRPPRDRE